MLFTNTASIINQDKGTILSCNKEIFPELFNIQNQPFQVFSFRVIDVDRMIRRLR